MTDESEDQRWERLSKDRVDRPLPKRFYKDVSVGPDRVILLDGRGVNTPIKAKLVLPTMALAEAVAQEWRAQDKVINPALMPLTKLANTAIDRLSVERAQVVAEVVAFARNDLVSYRAATPAELVEAQTRQWGAIVDWAQKALDADFKTTASITHVPQSSEALEAVEQHVMTLDDFALTAIHNAMTLTASALLALMLHARAITAEAAWLAAHVDEDFQISQWGEDFEAQARRAYRLAEFEATARFMQLLG